MKKRSKFLAGLLALTLGATTLVGCGTDKKDAQTGGAPKEEVIKIGLNFETTGGVASFGQSSVNGAKMAIDEVNAAGGINGKKIEMVVRDNKSEATESAAVMTRLVTNDKVLAVIGPVTSTNALAAAPIAASQQVPMISPTATNPDVTVDPNSKAVRDFVFRASFIDPFQGKVGADFAFKSLNAKKAVIYVDNSSDYSKGLAKVFEETFTGLGGEVLGTEAFIEKDTDFRATLTKIKGLNPDVIYVPAYYNEVGKIVRQAREMGMKQPIIGGDGFDAPQLIEIAGKENLTEIYFTNHYTPEDEAPIVQNFVKAYEAQFKAKPDALAALGYDAGLMMVDALKRSTELTPVAIKDALAATSGLEGVSGNISLDANHNPVKGAVIITVVDGAFKFHERVNP